MKKIGELTSDTGKNCGPTDLVVMGDDYMILADTDRAEASVEWHWFLPVPLT